MKNFKKIMLIFFLFIVYLFLSMYTYANNVSSDIANSVFRLHVIANSNSKEDQELKYLVRDNLISYMNILCNNISTKEEAIKLAEEHKGEFYEIAKRTIVENGFDYDVKIEIGNFAFPTKTYGDIALPSGYYDALKVEIGNFQGENWWCVMFPSLCFVDITNGVVPEESKNNLQLNLNEEDYNVIASEHTDYQFKFKIIEFFENAKLIMAKK